MNIITDMKCADVKCHEIRQKLNVISRGKELGPKVIGARECFGLIFAHVINRLVEALNRSKCCRFPFQLFNQSFNGVSVTK